MLGSLGFRPSAFSLAFAALLVAGTTAEAQFCTGCEKSVAVEVGDTPFVGSATDCSIPPIAGGCALHTYNAIFFAFTPSESGAYRISTCTSATEEMLLSVWTDCGGFGAVACGFYGCPGGGSSGSRIGNVDLLEGVTYRIAIGGFAPGVVVQGGTLSIEPIDSPGAGCATAAVAAIGLNPFDTTKLSEIVDLGGSCEPWPQGGDFDDRLYNTTYFQFTPPSSGLYTMTTCGQGEQVWERLAVLAGCSAADGVLACSNSGCGSDSDATGAIIVAVLLEGGVEYTVLVGGVLPSSAGAGGLVIQPFVPCPAPKPTVFEVETCGEDLNSACPGAQNAAQPIELGDSIRGTMWADGGNRDFDWYLLDLAEGTEVTLEINSEFPAFATFVFADCTSDIFVDQTLGLCPGLTDGECLPAGQYFVVVAPYDLSGFPCGYPSGNAYTLTVTGEPCDASPPPNDRCIDAITVSEGTTPFDNFFAGTDVSSKTCNLIGRDVWFDFTAGKAGNYKFAVCGGEVPFNSGMDIWTACPENGGQVFACNRDANDPDCANSTFSTIILPMTAGQNVRVRVGSEWFLSVLPPGAAELVVTAIGVEPTCGDPALENCCEERSGPYCNDIACCNFVCMLDPVCCAEAWDRTCVGAAALFCSDSCATPPPNDECSIPLPANLGANPFRNAQAQGSTETPCGTIFSDVWFTYTATTDRPVTLSLCDADGGWALVTGGDGGELDTRIAVFDFCGGSLIACNDNACGGASRVTFTPTCGSTYLVAIGSRDDDEGIYSRGIGSFVLLQSGSCGGGCPADIDGDGEVSSSDLGALLSAWGTAGADLDGDGETGSSDLGVLLSAWGPCG
jgi:hypothetical protein